MKFSTSYNRGVGGARVKAKAAQSPNFVFWMNLALAVAVVGMFVGYLAMNNHAATKGFAIRDIERKISDLRDEARRLDLEVVAMQSMDSIGQHVDTLGFVPVGQVEYLNAGPSVVAVR